MRRFRFLMITALLLMFWHSVQIIAQENLLANASFEDNYSGRGRGDFNFPESWGGWWTDSPRLYDWMNIEPIAFPHTAGYKRSGDRSLNIGRGSATFTAAAYQTVMGIPAGSQLRASAWVFLENVSESGAQVRIGIGNNVGGDPFGGDIVWSDWMRNVQSWQQVSVSGVAKGGSVTVFIYTTQNQPNNPNGFYVDDAELIVTGTGEIPVEAGAADGEGEAAPAEEPAAPAAPAVVEEVVPFVNPQENISDGAIVHTVQSGDTLNSIAVAYGVPASEISARNNITNPGLIRPGDVLVIADAPPTEIPPTATPEPSPTLVPTEPQAAPPQPTQVAMAAPQANAPTRNLLMVLQNLPRLFLGALARGASAAPQPVPEQPADTGDTSDTTGEAAVVSADEADEAAVVSVDEADAAAVVSADEADEADEAAAVVAVEATPTNTQPPTNTPLPTHTPTETLTPTITLTPTDTLTPTEAPPAPVVEVETMNDPTSPDSEVCVLMFEDGNQNRIQEQGEGLLAGGTISLQTADGGEIASYETEGSTNEAFCFDEITPGTYRAQGSAPAGYGMTTPPLLRVDLEPGTRFVLSFGAAQGVQVAAAPPPDAPTDANADAPQTAPLAAEADPFDLLLENSGLVVMALAGVIFVIGFGMSLLLRPRG